MTQQDSPFRFPPTQAPAGRTAEDLFSLLSRSDRTVQQLWSHQADTLREFHKLHEEPDVAIELPTGSGKTLIALLIAEWTRRTENARVLYLCPDNALVNQVVNKAEQYGISAAAFTGSHRQYVQADVSAFNSGSVIGVSNYWTMFNSNPRLRPSHVILDDAHAAGQAIVSVWHVDLSRREAPLAFAALSRLLEPWLGSTLLHAIREDEPSSVVELIPPPVVIAKAESIAEILDANLEQYSPPYFSWSEIRNNLPSCNIFVSATRISIRPVMPPTHTTPAFNEAKQRLYVSATLGGEGDLERTIGRTPIKYVRSPLRGSIGRRFVMFGDTASDDRENRQLFEAILRTSARAIFLTASEREADEIASQVEEAAAGHTILRNSDIRSSYDPFTNAERAALILANRYDGVDLPHDTCRTLFMYGLPWSLDLQERFLWSGLGVRTALWSRMSTRISQGLGRTARGFGDFTVAVLCGTDLLDFVSMSDHLEQFNPVLAAEIGFATQQIDTPLPQKIQMLQSFLAQDAQWWEAEQYLNRQAQDIHPPELDAALRGLAPREVAFARALWDQDYVRAVRFAKEITDVLDDDRFSGYKSWWYLQLFIAANLASTSDYDYSQIALDAISTGRRLTVNGSLFSAISHSREPGLQDTASLPSEDEGRDVVAGRILAHIQRLGFTGVKFERSAAELQARTRKTLAKEVHVALRDLGSWLGIDTWYEDRKAAPDTIWQLANGDVIAFEAKTEKTNQKLSYDDLRQAAGHEKWIRGNWQPLEDGAAIKIVVVSDSTEYDEAAVSFAEGLHHWSMANVSALASSAIDQLRALRNKIGNIQDVKRGHGICIEALQSSTIEPSVLFEQLEASRLSDSLLPTIE